MNRIYTLLLFFILVNSVCFAQVTDYRVQFSMLTLKGDSTEIVSLRSFTLNSKKSFLCVNPKDCSTYIVPEDRVASVQALNFLSFIRTSKACLYKTLYVTASKRNTYLENAGLTRKITSQQGIYVTIDLCPSLKPLDRALFDSIISIFDSTQRPIPIAISLAGSWTKAHTDDLKWLKQWDDSKTLEIEWINHSLHHFVSDTLPLKKNYLLRPSTNLEKEILGNEVLMINHGLVPSVFFRFPGLVSNADIFERVLKYGLIPLGTDAWLAKKQKPTNGSIVLIHGNENEPRGVTQFYRLLSSKKASIRIDSWRFISLRDSL